MQISSCRSIPDGHVPLRAGTDPTEGEALAAALLQRLAAIARLTFATTHHAGLKEMADAQFVNASVEFDIATLRPTYRSDGFIPLVAFGWTRRSRMPCRHLPWFQSNDDLQL